MTGYAIVVEPDNVARYTIDYATGTEATYTAPGVSVLDSAFLAAYRADNGLDNDAEALAHMGIVDGRENASGLP